MMSSSGTDFVHICTQTSTLTGVSGAISQPHPSLLYLRKRARLGGQALLLVAGEPGGSRLHNKDLL